MDSQNADNTQQFYEYCTVPSPTSRDGDLSTFVSNEYEMSIEEKPPPELPVRPHCLAPLSNAQTIPVFRDNDSIPFSRPESLYSRQFLLTPHTSEVKHVLDEENNDTDPLPKRSAENYESTLTKIMHMKRK